MSNRWLCATLALTIGAYSVFGQAPQAEQPVPLLGDPGLMTGLILEATGFGLVIGAGAATSISLDAALVMMQIAPACSAAGAWVSHSRMRAATSLWQSRGLEYNPDALIKNSFTAAIGTSAFAAAALVMPLIDDVGPYLSVACAGVAVIWDMIAFYAARSVWHKELNAAIVGSGLDWKSYR